MNLGYISDGDFAQAFANRALKAAHEALLSNSRGPVSTRIVLSSVVNMHRHPYSNVDFP